jgi:hypothetical protein
VIDMRSDFESDSASPLRKTSTNPMNQVVCGLALMVFALPITSQYNATENLEAHKTFDRMSCFTLLVDVQAFVMTIPQPEQ